MKKAIITTALLLLTFSSVAAQKKVLVIGMDGTAPRAVAWGLQHNILPEYTALSQNGFITYNITSVLGSNEKHNTWSAANWTSLLTGVEPLRHGIWNNDLDDINAVDSDFKGYQANLTPPVMLDMKKAGIETSSYIAWQPVDQAFGRYFTHRFTVKDDYDAPIVDKVISDLPTSNSDFIFVHLVGVDDAGHCHGYGINTPAYMEALKNSDTEINKIMTALKSRKKIQDEDWLVLITADHGGARNSTFHGDGNSPEIFDSFLIASQLKEGKWQKLHASIPDGHSIDLTAITPTYMNFLGVKSNIRFDSAPINISN
ncbi:TPA: alkaline phosphatase family protein [Escherichia coli]|nr:alkaline phosphatase family protein [Escherichia coli]